MSAPLLPAGVGIGWRPEIAGVVAGLPGLAFCEVVAESLPTGRRGRVTVPDLLAELRLPVVPHGIGLSLGGAEPVEPRRVARLAACAEALDAPLVSEHVAFVRAGGLEIGHLTPVPRTREALDAMVANVRRTQAGLGVPLALEPIAALVDWPDDELTEAQFLTDLLDRTGALLLLDVANVYANAVNRGTDARADLAALPLERVAYCHVAGGALREGRYHDTHTDPVPREVLDLLTEAGVATAMLERDGDYPPAAELRAEFAAIGRALVGVRA